MPQTSEQIAGKLKQIKGKVNKKWGRVSDSEQLKIKQKRALLVDNMKKKSGHDSEDAPTIAAE